MRFQMFEPRLDAHVRKSREYLNEANLARVEHQAAAEHHTALAKMYTERVARLEAEINNALQPPSMSARPRVDDIGEECERPNSESVVYPVYPSRTARS